MSLVIENQQWVFDQERFRDQRSDATRTQQFGDRYNEMDESKNPVSHPIIVCNRGPLTSLGNGTLSVQSRDSPTAHRHAALPNIESPARGSGIFPLERGITNKIEESR